MDAHETAGAGDGRASSASGMDISSADWRTTVEPHRKQVVQVSDRQHCSPHLRGTHAPASTLSQSIKEKLVKLVDKNGGDAASREEKLSSAAIRFEEQLYKAANSRPEYLQGIKAKMAELDAKFPLQQPPPSSGPTCPSASRPGVT